MPLTPRTQHYIIFSSRSIIQTPIRIPTNIISPPRRKRSCNTTSPGDRKREQEDHDLGAAIHAGRDEVVPLDELLGAVLAEVPLADEADDEVDPDRGVDADDEVAHVPEDDGQVEVGPHLDVGLELVHDVEGQGDQEAEEVGCGHPFVALPEGEHLGRHGPGDGVGVDGLDPGAGPDGGSFDGEEDGGLLFDDAVGGGG